MIPQAPLQSEEINRRYRQDGYVFPVNALTENRALAAASRIEAFVREPPVGLRHPWHLKTHLLFDWVFALATQGSVLDAVESAIGPNILLQAADLFYKPAHGSKHINWHQDANYWNLEPFEICTAWIALTDAHPKNGCMRYMPGSHVLHKLEHEETMSQSSDLTRGQEIRDMDESTAVPVVLNAGQMSLHHCLLAHASDCNNTSAPRIALAVRFMPAHVRQTAGPQLSVIRARGDDSGKNFRYDMPPDGELTEDAISAHDKAMSPHVTSGYATA